MMRSKGVVLLDMNGRISEYVARVYYLAKGRGEPTLLSDEEMDKVIEKFKGYGKK